MYKLYARPGTGSAVVEVLLAECGVEFEIIDVLKEADGCVPQSFRQINQRAEVPTLVLPDNSIMTESAAMMICLADLYPAAGLAPSVTSLLRARIPLRWNHLSKRNSRQILFSVYVVIGNVAQPWGKSGVGFASARTKRLLP